MPGKAAISLVFFIFVLISLLPFSAGCGNPTSAERGNSNTNEVTIPLLDTLTPTAIRTATFSLG